MLSERHSEMAKTQQIEGLTKNLLPRLKELHPAVQKFILHWGELGASWGVSRSVAQIHALLFISTRPINAEEISHCLGIARSNVSTSLKELLGWQMVWKTPIPGDRRDHYATQTDVWELAMTISRIRKQKEIDPAIATLKQCFEEHSEQNPLDQQQLERLQKLYEFLQIMDRWYAQMLSIPSQMLLRLIKMGDRIVAIAGLGKVKK